MPSDIGRPHDKSFAFSNKGTKPAETSKPAKAGASSASPSGAQSSDRVETERGHSSAPAASTNPAPSKPAQAHAVAPRPTTPPPLLNRAYVAAYAPDATLDSRIDEGCNAAEAGNLSEAYKIWDGAIADLGKAVPWQKMPVEKLGAAIAESCTTSRNAASTGEAFLEIALTIQQSDPKRAQAIYTALNDHRDLLREATRCAPLYNLACVVLEPLDAPSPAEMRRGMALLLESMKDTVRAQDPEDLAATKELLPRTDGSLWRLHAEHKPFIHDLMALMDKVDAGAGDVELLCQKLDALKP